jgi:CBS domain containing-hemolysin-like protein
VTLDDVFIELVGSGVNEEDEMSEQQAVDQGRMAR